MRVLILGAEGYLGAALLAQLRAAGHEVWAGVRHPPQDQQQCCLDFSVLTHAEHWCAALPAVDAVINAVGAIRDQPGRPLARLHAQAPMALWAACARLGLRRVIQISALGADRQSPYVYWRTKGVDFPNFCRRFLSSSL